MIQTPPNSGMILSDSQWLAGYFNGWIMRSTCIVMGCIKMYGFGVGVMFVFSKAKTHGKLDPRDPKTEICWQFTQIDYLPITWLVVHARFRPSLGVLRQTLFRLCDEMHYKTHLSGRLLFFTRANPFVDAQSWRRIYPTSQLWTTSLSWSPKPTFAVLRSSLVWGPFHLFRSRNISAITLQGLTLPNFRSFVLWSTLLKFWVLALSRHGILCGQIIMM